MQIYTVYANTVAVYDSTVQSGCSMHSKFLLCVPHNLLRVSCAVLLSSAWYGNTALPQRTLYINLLLVWLCTAFVKTLYTFRNEVVAFGIGLKKKERKK
jgi:hypothetical protein